MIAEGKTVEVNEDPITKKIKEGDARIIRCIEEANIDGIGTYEVNFVGDDPEMVVTRMIDERFTVTAEVV